MADLQDPADSDGSLIAASTVIGTAVYDGHGGKLGTIHDIMLDIVSGHAEYAVLNFGGLFGVGGTYHPLPWATLHYDTALGGYVVHIDRDRLDGAPAYDGDHGHWVSDGVGSRVKDYYGTPGHDDLATGLDSPAAGGMVPII